MHDSTGDEDMTVHQQAEQITIVLLTVFGGEHEDVVKDAVHDADGQQPRAGVGRELPDAGSAERAGFIDQPHHFARGAASARNPRRRLQCVE